MKTLFLLLIVLCTSLEAVFAQDKAKLDSLKQVLAKLTPEGRSFASDTIRIMVQGEIGLHTDDSSLLYRTLNLSNYLKWKEGQVDIGNKIGLLLFRKGYYYNAADVLYTCLHIAETIENKHEQGLSHHYLGDCFFALEDDEKAKYHYTKALLFFDTFKGESRLYKYLLSLNNLGVVYTQQKKYSEAIECFKKGLNYNKALADESLEEYFLSNLGSAYREVGRYRDSEDIILKVLLKKNSNKAYLFCELSKTYLQMNNLKKAFYYAKKAQKYEQKASSFNKKYIYETLYQVYKQMGNESLALKYHEYFFEIKTKNDSKMKQKSIEGLKFSYENQRKQTEIESQIQKIKQQEFKSNALFVGLLLFLFFGGIMFRNNIVLNHKNRKIAEQNMEILIVKNKLDQTNNALISLNQNLEEKVKERTSELQKALDEIKEAMFKGQTIERKRVASELHDNLGSLLSGIKWRLEAINGENLTKNEKKIYTGVVSLLSDAYKEVRLISHNLLPATLEENGLIEALRKFINDLNESNRIVFTIQAEELMYSLEPNMNLELYSICMELINNVIKHSNAKFANLKIYCLKNLLHIEIIDDGSGLNDENLLKGQGFKNIKNRVQILSGQLQILFPKDGTHITISIPLTESAMQVY